MMKFESFSSDVPIFSPDKEIVGEVNVPEDFTGAFLDSWSSGSADDLGILFNDAEMSSMGGSPSEDDACDLDQNISSFSLNTDFPDCKSPTKLPLDISVKFVDPQEETNKSPESSKCVKKAIAPVPTSLTSSIVATTLKSSAITPITSSTVSPTTTTTTRNLTTASTPTSHVPTVLSNDCKMEVVQDSGSCSPDSAAESDSSLSQKIKRSPAELKRQQNAQSHRSGSFFDILTSEERRMMEAEGVVIPADGPLTKMHERELKRLRRQIKNKYSAKDSRRKRKEYIENLEAINNRLSSQVSNLHGDNNSLRKQLHSIKKLIQPRKVKGSSPSTLIMLCLLLSRNNKSLNPSNSMDTSVDETAGLSTASTPRITPVTEGITLESMEESHTKSKQLHSVFSMADPTRLLLKSATEGGWDSIFPTDSDMAVEGVATFEPAVGDAKPEFPWVSTSIADQILNLEAETSASLDHMLG
eukprot:m.120773 g.120773  ORF g.120773 m.120773 type:complete len:471 (+) comp28829_c2_seq1:394-1806(+)